MLDTFEDKLTVTFLCDNSPPAKIVVLKRGPHRKLAPNLYTGIGGHIEEGEDELTAARRELEEETGINDVELTEFGRLIINKNKKLLTYSFGTYNLAALPYCNEGTLEWLQLSDFHTKEFIPTTRGFMEVWKKRNFELNSPFTIYIEREDPNDINSLIVSSILKEGLHY